MKRVFLHIGEPKCGTTFLQDVVWNNRTALARQGLTLPGFSEHDHFRAAQDLRGVPQPSDDPAGSWLGEWDLLARQVRQTPNDVLIAHELLAGADAAQADRAVRSLAPAQIHVVLTVRDMASLLPAEWQETVKHRNRRSWDGWLADIADPDGGAQSSRLRWFWQVHDTLTVLRRWASHVPPDRVHVIPLPRPPAPPETLWTRFAGVLGVDPESADLSATRRNASLGVIETQFLVRLNRILPSDLPDWYYTRAVKHRLVSEVLAPRRPGDRLRLPASRQRWAEQRTEELVAELRVAGFDIVGDLADLRPSPAAGTGTHPREVSDGELLAVALDCIAAMLEDGYRNESTPLLARAAHALRRLSIRYPAVGRVRTSAAVLTDKSRRPIHD